MTDTSWLDDEVLKEATPIPKDSQLAMVAQLADEQLKIEHNIMSLEASLSTAKKDLRAVAEGKLPELMRELGLKSFELANGMKIKVAQYFEARITDPEGFNWLENHGMSDIVKMNLTIGTRRSEKARLQPLIDLAATLNVEIAMKEAVHAMTLKAFVADSVRNGKELDFNLLNVYVGNKATIK